MVEPSGNQWHDYVYVDEYKHFGESPLVDILLMRLGMERRYTSYLRDKTRFLREQLPKHEPVEPTKEELEKDLKVVAEWRARSRCDPHDWRWTDDKAAGRDPGLVCNVCKSSSPIGNQLELEVAKWAEAQKLERK